MNLNEYQSKAMRTSRKDIDNLLNSALGMCGEVGEIVDCIKKYKFQGHTLDVNKISEELGDLCWYMVLLCNCLNIKLEYVLLKNIKKLEKRYKVGFSEGESINREMGN